MERNRCLTLNLDKVPSPVQHQHEVLAVPETIMDSVQIKLQPGHSIQLVLPSRSCESLPEYWHRRATVNLVIEARARTHPHTHTHSRTYMHMHTRMHARTRTQTHARAYMLMHTQTHKRTHTDAYMCMQARMHACTDTPHSLTLKVEKGMIASFLSFCVCACLSVCLSV